MFLLVHWLPKLLPCRGSSRLDRSTSGHLLETTMQGPSVVVGLTNKKVGGGRGGGGGGEGRTEGETERGRGDSANRRNKDRPEEFSTVKLVGEERGRDCRGTARAIF